MTPNANYNEQPSDLGAAVANFLAALDDPNASRAVRGKFRRLIMAAQQQTPAARNAAIEQMKPYIDAPDLQIASTVALAIGALIEQEIDGADAERVVDAVIARLVEVLPLARRFVEGCVAQAPAPIEGEEEELDAIEAVGAEVAETMPDEAAAFTATRFFVTAALAMLQRAPDANQRARNNSGLHEALSDWPIYPDFIEALVHLLLVRDEE